jgi:glutamyl-tRNA synthetase
MSKVRVRFAPSPTGKPHTGNIRTAVFDWLFARHTGGQMVLRIEDTDRERLDPLAAAEMMKALRWIGVDWDEGPDIGGPFGPYIQSERTQTHLKYADELIAFGSAYRCYCSRERLEALRKSQEERGLPTGYDRRCRYLSPEERAKHEDSGAPFTVRLAMPREGTVHWQDGVFGNMSWEYRLIDDQVIVKSDGFALYHLAATVDDHLMEITHVIRGEEWLSSTPKHIFIYESLGWTPPNFIHTTHILGPGRRKLSKREASSEFLNFAKEGYLPEAVLNFVALIGWTPPDGREILTREELIAAFSEDGLVGHAAILDEEKLLWYNGQYIRSLPLAELADRSLPFLRDAGLIDNSPTDDELNYLARVISLEQERIKTLTDVAPLAEFFLLPDDRYIFDDKAVSKWFQSPGVSERLEWIREQLIVLDDFEPTAIEQVIRQGIEKFAVKPGEVIHPVRVAVSGRTVGPGLYETIAVLGQERTNRRLLRALIIINNYAIANH